MAWHPVNLSLLNVADFLQHFFIGWTFSVIHFDKFPAHDSLAINHIGCRMWNGSFRFVIEQSVSVNNFVIHIREHGVINAGLPFQAFPQGNGFVTRVNADGENFDFIPVLFIRERFQLSKLSGAVGSPVPAIKHQHNGFLSAKF